MASPAVSTASSAGSPPAIASAPPTLASRNINAANLNVLSLPQAGPIMGTRKEWIIPPRPKPGRKPATDTPPTKRKAQNRAAQRAFRERRAARVGELEEQLDEVTNDHQRRESDLRNKIGKLEADIERFSGEVQSWRVRCDTLDRIAEYERKEKEAALAELAYLRHGSRTTGTDAVPLPPRHPRHNEPRASHEQEYTAPDTEPGHPGCGSCTSSSNCACADQAMAIATVGCGNCGPDTHCECLEETIKAASDISSELKRPHSPSDPHNEKRQRHSEASTPLEIDFTSQFSSKPVQSQEVVIHTSHRQPGESCGFCEEGTYCMCAEAAAAAAANVAHQDRDDENKLAPLLNEVTPPLSDTDTEGPLGKLPSLQPNQMHRPFVSDAPSNSCANGPGTCQQCLSDPKSGLFCRSLAAARAAGTNVPDGCCGGNGGGDRCCKSMPVAAPSHPPPSLSCADTYKTLASHKNFDQASDELSTWLGRLHATPPAHPGRAPMEVEAASVMGVLKLFDRRFGRG
ncbi:hypothetical protein QTJ16_002267 [Diplocarpon rosae]|uniref:BZIP domain-containing protein n=1 Tax=Diplocarpon rosae TaxID=946125 RepID=A0AAD9WH75_9HELO|nr:hypothetical protein QTJ16_002267 [Diplocarpon rosae]